MWVTASILDVFGSRDRPPSLHGSSGVRELTEVAIREDERSAGAVSNLDHFADQNPMRAERECFGNAAIEARERAVQHRGAGDKRAPGAGAETIPAQFRDLAREGARN